MAQNQARRGNETNLVYRFDLPLKEPDLLRLREVLRYAALTELARLDPGKELDSQPLGPDVLNEIVRDGGQTQGMTLRRKR